MFKYKKWELKLKDVKAYDVLRFEATITELSKTEGIAEDGGNE